MTSEDSGDNKATYAQAADCLRLIEAEALEGFHYVLRTRGNVPGFKYQDDWVSARLLARHAVAQLAALEKAVGTERVHAFLKNALQRARSTPP